MEWFTVSVESSSVKRDSVPISFSSLKWRSPKYTLKGSEKSVLSHLDCRHLTAAHSQIENDDWHFRVRLRPEALVRGRSPSVFRYPHSNWQWRKLGSHPSGSERGQDRDTEKHRITSRIGTFSRKEDMIFRYYFFSYKFLVGGLNIFKTANWLRTGVFVLPSTLNLPSVINFRYE